MKATEAAAEPRRNGFLNAHQHSTDEEEEDNGGGGAPQTEDPRATGGPGAEPKKSLIATLGGTHLGSADFPALNGGGGGARFETVRINHVGTRLSDRILVPSSPPAEPAAGRLLNGDKEPEDLETSWDRTVAEVKEQAFARLQDELKKARVELRLRDEEVSRLSRIREEVESELEDLTASLFQEAHNMVREANVRQLAAERSLKESQMQVDVLLAEVAALKTLVLTSTPSRPNPHLHPQIDPSRSKDDASVTGVSLFTRKHRRSPSHFNLKYGRENSPPESPVKESRASLPEPVVSEARDGCEVDPVVHREFVSWRQAPSMDKGDPFIARVYAEDIATCLDFCNEELAARVGSAVETGNIFIEAVSDKAKNLFPKKCALLEAPRQCHYRMKLGDQEQWYCISQICRNRITAVCDFLNYLRYIERGLVKSSVHDVYWEIVRLRKEMVLARLGLPLSS
ncbi:guanine nucleotide exchange factor for Rab-3A-like [Bacillus rossius redtenbacheri]|uniref:guanine nucleotide exchange factor for Rab-3A-like n=1 Tax=Bacillus rossius redtenbacheri TaxID=93214 RepID=UPI002FDCF184